MWNDISLPFPMTALPVERNSEEWIKWRMCTRKIQHHEKPRNTPRMESYVCPYCGHWHRTTRKHRLPPTVTKPSRPMVLRGGYWIEK